MYYVDINDTPLVIGDYVLYDFEEYGVNAVVEGKVMEISKDTISIKWDDIHFQHDPWYAYVCKVSPSYILRIVKGCAPCVPDIHEKKQ